MSMMNMVGSLKEKAEEIEGVAKEKVIEGMDEFKKAVTLLETFGFSIGRFTVGMGILPEISTSITGSIENIQVEGLKKIIEDHQADKLLVSMLNALIMAKRLWEHVELKLTAATLNVTLGMPPKIAVEMH